MVWSLTKAEDFRFIRRTCKPEQKKGMLEYLIGKRKIDLLQFSPCDLWPYLAGRTLWVIGDSHTKVRYKTQSQAHEYLKYCPTHSVSVENPSPFVKLQTKPSVSTNKSIHQRKHGREKIVRHIVDGNLIFFCKIGTLNINIRKPVPSVVLLLRDHRDDNMAYVTFVFWVTSLAAILPSCSSSVILASEVAHGPQPLPQPRLKWISTLLYRLFSGLLGCFELLHAWVE